MPIPTPPLRPCTRYQADGTGCTRTTQRADRWCGQCDGYTTPAAPASEPNTRPTRPSRNYRPGVLGLDPDEAHDIDVPRAVAETYIKIHHVTVAVARTEIRSLLEDMITLKADVEISESGNWRVQFRDHGYTLLLNADRDRVLDYRTGHRERTWSQYRQGTRSRIAGRKRKTGVSETILQALPINVAPRPFALYARKALGLSANSANADTIAHHLADHLTENVLPKWQRTPHESVDDGQGGTWILTCGPDTPDGLVIALHATDPPSTVQR